MTSIFKSATIHEIFGGVTVKYLLSLCLPIVLIGYELKVEVQNISSSKGQISIGLYKDKKNFADTKKFYRGVILPASAENSHHTFTNIPQGKYAIALFHDTNSNGRLDKNFLGIPKEGYGFSNNPQRGFSKPSFEQCSFRLQGNQTKQINARY